MEEKKMKLDLKQFENVNYFNGIDRGNLVIQGDMDIYVPHVIRQLWFRSTYPKGQIKTSMLNTMEDLQRYMITSKHFLLLVMVPQMWRRIVSLKLQSAVR